MTYNTSFIDNQSGILPFVEGVNDNSGGLFGYAILFVIFIILYARFSGSNQDRFVGASFITTLIAGAAFGLGLLESWQLVFPTSALMIGLITKIWGEG